MELERRFFLLGSALLFAACAIFAAWRVMCNALQVRTLPWAWPLFAVALTLYFTGLADAASEAPVFALSYIGLFIAAVMTYATLFSEPSTLLMWNRLRLRQQRRDWRGWLEHLPLWPTTLLLALVLALLATATQPAQARYALPHTVFLQEPLSLALMLLRDACIVLFFSFAPSAKRPAAVAVLYLIVIDALLPFLFKVAGLDILSYFFFPAGEQYSMGTSLVVMASHAVIALGLVTWRLRNATAA